MSKLWCVHNQQVIEPEDWWTHCPCGTRLGDRSYHKDDYSPYFKKSKEEIWEMQTEKELVTMKKRVKKALGTDNGVKIIRNEWGYSHVEVPVEYTNLERKKRWDRYELNSRAWRIAPKLSETAFGGFSDE